MVQMVKRGMTNPEPGTSYYTSQNISVIEWLRTSVTGIQTYQMVGNLYAILTQFTLTKKGFFYYNWYKKKKKKMVQVLSILLIMLPPSSGLWDQPLSRMIQSLKCERVTTGVSYTEVFYRTATPLQLECLYWLLGWSDGKIKGTSGLLWRQLYCNVWNILWQSVIRREVLFF